MKGGLFPAASSLFGWILRLLGSRRHAGARDRERREAVSAHRQVNPVAWSSMAALLEDLETLGDEFPELFDTDVRERVHEVVRRQLLAQTEPVAVPADLGMLSADGNTRLQALLHSNLESLREVFAIFELDTEQKRSVSFFNAKLKTERGARVEDFFGSP